MLSPTRRYWAGGRGPPGTHRLLRAVEDGGAVAGSTDEGSGSRPGSCPCRHLRLRPSLLDGGDEGHLPASQGGFQRGTAVRALVKLLYTRDDLLASQEIGPPEHAGIGFINTFEASVF